MAAQARRLGKTGVLGAFEELVLLALLHEVPEAYAVSVRRALTERLGADVAMGAVYGTLDRLEEKALIQSRADDRKPTRPGRPRTYYDIHPDGLRALAQTRRIRNSMWQGVTLPAMAGGRPMK